MEVPYTVSLCPAKSIVLTPRVCCCERMLEQLDGTGPQVREEFVNARNVRRCALGEINWRAKGALKERLMLRIAIVRDLSGSQSRGRKR